MFCRFKIIATVALLVILIKPCGCQPVTDYAEYRQLDSLAGTEGRAKYFAALYTATLLEIEKQLQQQDSGAAAFTRKFELAFVHYFTDACAWYSAGKNTDTVWHSYFYGPEKNALEYLLTGANAHINGDLWKALVSCCTEDDISRYAGVFIAYQKALNTVFDTFYTEALHRNKRLKLYHTLSLGLSRALGKWTMRRWRVRQEKLALLYFTDKKNFEQQLYRLEKKKHRFDKRILYFF
jgi:hypothetical protein